MGDGACREKESIASIHSGFCMVGGVTRAILLLLIGCVSRSSCMTQSGCVENVCVHIRYWCSFKGCSENHQSSTRSKSKGGEEGGRARSQVKLALGDFFFFSNRARGDFFFLKREP
jgi:hypothetical protein